MVPLAPWDYDITRWSREDRENACHGGSDPLMEILAQHIIKKRPWPLQQFFRRMEVVPTDTVVETG